MAPRWPGGRGSRCCRATRSRVGNAVSVFDIVAILLLLAVNGFFVAAEFALIAARSTQIEPLASTGSRRARTVLAAMDAVPTMLAAAQLGVTLASLALGALGEPTIARALRPLFHAIHVPEGLAHPVAFTLALLTVVSAHILIGEMVPKNLALAAPEKAALWLVPPLLVFARLTRPILIVIKALATLTLRLLRLPITGEAQTVYTPDELPALIDESREHRLLDAGEHERMIATLSLHARPVSDVMVPMEQVVSVAPDTTPAGLQEYAGRYGHSRFPVVTEEGELRGYLHILDALNGHPPGHPLPVRAIPRVPPCTTLAEVLGLMRRSRAQVAAVTGGPGDAHAIGVATLDDVLAGLLNSA
ncbi:MAG: putative integral rane protein [Actinomycetia bacterium]|nr:putative integral rane protein [Actinomycetes bacterium]